LADGVGKRTATSPAEPRLLDELDGDKRLMAGLMCGVGLRLMERLRLRVQDVDFGANQVTVRDGKGVKSPLDG
jgi:integrase